MKEFFESLKEKRQEKNISLEDIHQKSRLPLEYLEAIESGNVNVLPSGYERIYLRRYAKEAGLDVEEVLNDFDVFTGNRSPKETKPVVEKPQQVEKPSSTPPKKNVNLNNYTENLNLDRIHKVFWIALAVIIVFGAGYFTYQQYVSNKTNPELQVREIPTSRLIQEKNQEDSLATASVIAASQTDTQIPSLNIELRGVAEKTWVGEIRDDQDTTDYFISQGIIHRLQAYDRVEFRLGKANGIEIWLNGKNLGVYADHERVANFFVTREGIVRN